MRTSATGVIILFTCKGIKICHMCYSVLCLVTQSCPTLCDPMDCSSNFICILPFEFPYCFASSLYLQLENINNASSKPSNPDIKLTYAQLSPQVLLSTSKAMFLHNFPIIPYSSHIQCTYNQLSWVSVPLRFLPHCPGRILTPFHLVIYLP